MLLKIFFLNFLLLFSVLYVSSKVIADPQGENTMQEEKIGEVLKKHTKSFMSVPGVVGTAQGLCDGNPCIKVLVTDEFSKSEQKIPGSVEGYPVVIEKTGEIRPLPLKE
jgi:hypothetical protein